MSPYWVGQRRSGIYSSKDRFLTQVIYWVSSNKRPISDDWHTLGVEWQASSADSANDGTAVLRFDGVPQGD
jgi:hypothetical protein